MRASRSRWPLAAAALLFGLWWPAIARGQEVPAGPPVGPPDLKKWDASAGVGWFNRRSKVDVPIDYSIHDSSLWAGVALGRYWTEHLKTEIEVASAGTSQAWVPQDYADPSLPPATYPYVVSAQQNVSGLQVAAVAGYQFFHNAWFHPAVAAGVVLERARTTTDRPAQTLYYGYTPGSSPPSILVPAQSTSRVEWNADPIAQAGFKLYVSEHAFLRADLRLTLREHVNTTGRAGFGVDF